MQEKRIPLVRHKNEYQPIKVKSLQYLIQLIERAFPDFTYDLKAHSSDDMLIHTPQGYKELKFQTHYGYVHPQNLNEIKYRGIGYIFSVGQQTIYVNCFVQYLLVPNRSSAYVGTAYIELQEKDLEFYSKDFSLNPFGEEFGAPSVIFMGHTHPGNLSTEMSLTDKNTHRKAMRTEHWMSVIINPHRMKISAYVGSDFHPVHVLTPETCEQAPAKKVPMKKSRKCELVLSSDEIVAKITFFTKRFAFITFNKSVRLIDYIESED